MWDHAIPENCVFRTRTSKTLSNLWASSGSERTLVWPNCKLWSWVKFRIKRVTPVTRIQSIFSPEEAVVRALVFLVLSTRCEDLVQFLSCTFGCCRIPHARSSSAELVEAVLSFLWAWENAERRGWGVDISIGGKKWDGKWICCLGSTRALSLLQFLGTAVTVQISCQCPASILLI